MRASGDRRPQSAGFVGAFRSAIKPGSLRAKPGRGRPCSAPYVRIGSCEQLQATSTARPTVASASRLCVRTSAPPSKLGRPASAPILSRCEEVEAKKCSVWVLLDKHKATIHQQNEMELMVKQREATEDDRCDLMAHLSQQATAKRIARRRRDADRKNMEKISREFRRDQRQELQDAKKQSLEVKDMIQSQMLQSRQRHASEKASQIREDEASRLECARLVAEERAEKAAAAEAKQQEMVQTSIHLQEQTRLKRLAAKGMEEDERRIVKEYEELCERNEAARLAKLQARVDDQARRMAANSDVQKTKMAEDEVMIARIDRHWKEKYAADGEKFKQECLQRQQRLQDCNAHRKQQIDHDEHLLRMQHKEDAQFVSLFARQHMEAVAKDKEKAAAQKAQRKEHQHAVLAQIAEKKVRVPVEMTQTERDFNLAALSLAESH